MLAVAQRRLDAGALGDQCGQHQGRHRDYAGERLEQQQRGVQVGGGERAGAAQRAGDGNGAGQHRRGDRAVLVKSVRRPDEDRDDPVRQRAVLRIGDEHDAIDGDEDGGQRQRLDRTGASPLSRQPAGPD